MGKPDFKAMAKTRAEIKARQDAAKDKETRIAKAATLVMQARKEIDGISHKHLRRDVAEELHDAAHNFNVALSPAVGRNGRWQITWLSPRALKDGGNPYPATGDKSLIELGQSLIKLGMINPIEIDEEAVIITGHQRTRAAVLGGIALVPCKILKGLSTRQRTQRQVAENWTQRKGSAQNVNPMLLVNRMTQDEDGK